MTQKNPSVHEHEHSGDPLIDEVRARRQRLTERFGNDVDRLADYLRSIEAAHKGRVLKVAERPGDDRSNVA